MHLVGRHQGSWENLPPKGKALEVRNTRQELISPSATWSTWDAKTLTLQGKEPFWHLPAISCSLDAFSRLNVSDLSFVLDRPHTATEPAATRMIKSPREESAQAETHSLPRSWDRALLLNTMSQQAEMSSVPQGQGTDREEVSLWQIACNDLSKDTTHPRQRNN